MNELVMKENNRIKDKIYIIRGKQVMFDYDLAELYEVETKRINESVKRNIKKFPERCSWILTDEDSKNFLVANCDQKIETRGGRFKNPRVFTEQAVYMLATILKSDKAIEITLDIMDAFVLMKNYIQNALATSDYIDTMLLKHDKEINENIIDIKMLKESVYKLENIKEEKELYFNGKKYDAYSKVLDIFSEARNELIIIDGYTDKTLLDMVENLTCKVILITGFNTKITRLDIKKYNETYDNLKIIYNDTYHDRYFIIDKNKVYHSGNSVNHIGYRKSSINILEDEKVKVAIIEDIKKILSSKEDAFFKET